MRLITSLTEFNEWRRTLPAAQTVGFVPTMGALHDGHAALLRAARSQCDAVVLSIFVNPKQFGPSEDLGKYPRTLESDLALAAAAGVDAVFHPDAAEFYPAGFATTVTVEGLTDAWCGATRPGHFSGVTTVVLKLFNIVAPTRAYFGWKDAQQFLVLSKMVRDLCLPLDMVGVPTVREADGLALSSRNRYLSAALREKAPLLYKTLNAAALALERGEPWLAVCASAQDLLNTAGFEVQYLEPRSEADLALPASAALAPGVPYRLAVAALLGSTRLIDNIFVISSH